MPVLSTGCYPSREEFIRLSEQFNLVPVCREIMADLETPVSIYARAFPGSYSCLLESIEGSVKLARYSFMAGDPFLVLRAWGEQVELAFRDRREVKQGSFTGVLRELLARYRTPPLTGLPLFYGGAVGYVGYDAVRLFEHLPGRKQGYDIPDAVLLFPESVIAFDHYTSRIKIVVNVPLNGEPERLYRDAVKKVEDLTARIRRGTPERLSPVLARPGEAIAFKSNLTPEEFKGKVAAVKRYIRAGDIFQAVISQRFETEVRVPSFNVYRALRTLNPSPYMFYLDLDEVKMAGASPEPLVKLKDRVVETRPIAGTRPRGKTPEEDRQLEVELLQDPKERAEHVMLVDLGRNDLGRVSAYGSVEVPEFMYCERYSHVMHLVSGVKGRLREGRDALDALAACFPAGTVSGAPKVRAMEIIDELEPSGRGAYAGAVGYFGFNGDMDTCITIRTVVFAGGKIYAQAGAGIVADSDPEREFEETVNKARVLLQAVKMAGEEGIT